jgi:hypothetical protein
MHCPRNVVQCDLNVVRLCMVNNNH